MSKIIVIGAGAFGTALSYIFSKKESHNVVLKTRNNMGHDFHKNRLLKNVRITTSHEECQDATFIVLALPTQIIPAILQEIHPHLNPKAPLILVNKGILQENTIDTPFIFNWIQTHLPAFHPYVLSGPNFAAEMIQDLPAAATLAGQDASQTMHIAQTLCDPLFRLYPTTDTTGVSLAGAIKNIYAIACGMCHGLNLGQNARAALITRALAESKRLGCAMGAKADTFLGLAGVGDLLLSCCSDMSRNMTLGMELAKGKTLRQITDQNNNHNREHNLNHKPTPLTEGIFTVKALQPLLQHYQIRMPIASAVYDILYNDITIQQSMMDLLHTLSTPFEHE